MEGLSPLDLDEMAHAIATAVQGVGAQGELQGAEKGAAGKPGEASVGKQGADGMAGEPPSRTFVGVAGRVEAAAVQRPSSPGC